MHFVQTEIKLPQMMTPLRFLNAAINKPTEKGQIKTNLK